MPAASERRRRDRSVGVMFRLSPEQRTELGRRAEEAGITVQTLLERIVLNNPDAQDVRPPRSKRKHNQEELPVD